MALELKYTVIKNKQQYHKYCDILDTLLDKGKTSKDIEQEIELLELLIAKWDEEHNSFKELDPIQLLKGLMTNNKIKSKDLADILDVGKSLVSDILSYKKGLSKEVIRKLSMHFKVSQEAFNRPYKLVNPANSHLRDASVMNTRKELSLSR